MGKTRAGNAPSSSSSFSIVRWWGRRLLKGEGKGVSLPLSPSSSVLWGGGDAEEEKPPSSPPPPSPPFCQRTKQSILWARTFYVPPLLPLNNPPGKNRKRRERKISAQIPFLLLVFFCALEESRAKIDLSSLEEKNQKSNSLLGAIVGAINFLLQPKICFSLGFCYVSGSSQIHCVWAPAKPKKGIARQRKAKFEDCFLEKGREHTCGRPKKS